MAISLTTFEEIDAIVAPALPVAGKSRVYMDSTGNNLRASENGAAYDSFVLLAKAQTLTGKTLTAPTIGDMTNANHAHTAGAGGGLLTNSALTSGAYAAITGIGAQAQDLNLNSNKITNLAAPVAGSDAARKSDVDAATAGLAWKDSVRVATAAALPAVTYANGTLGVGATLTASAVGVLTVDGLATVLNDRILVKDQASGLQNGVYKVTTEGTAGVAFVLTRVTDSDEAAEVVNAAVFAESGTTNADSGWTQTVDAPITMGTTALVFTQFTGLGQITAGDGLTKSGNTIDVGAGTGIIVNASVVAVDQAFTPTWTGVHTFTDATSPIVTAKLGPVTTQQHVLPAVASDTIALLAATQTLTGKTLGATTMSGNLLPNADNTLNIGSDALRFALVRATTITTGDLNLRSDDGTASWTVIEEPDRLVLVNRITGQRFKMSMESID